MCCLRKYLNVRMYAEFNLHTESTLSETQDELENKFYSCLLVYNSQMTNYRVAITNLINQRPTYNLLAPQRLPHLINYNQMAHIGKRGLRAWSHGTSQRFTFGNTYAVTYARKGSPGTIALSRMRRYMGQLGRFTCAGQISRTRQIRSGWQCPKFDHRNATDSSWYEMIDPASRSSFNGCSIYS